MGGAVWTPPGGALAPQTAPACRAAWVCGWNVYRGEGPMGVSVHAPSTAMGHCWMHCCASTGAAAKAFFESARSVVGRKLKQVTTDGHTSYPRAIQETLGHHFLFGQPHRAASSRHQAALLSDASIGPAKRCGIILGHGRRWGKPCRWAGGGSCLLGGT